MWAQIQKKVSHDGKEDFKNMVVITKGNALTISIAYSGFLLQESL